MKGLSGSPVAWPLYLKHSVGLRRQIPLSLYIENMALIFRRADFGFRLTVWVSGGQGEEELHVRVLGVGLPHSVGGDAGGGSG